METSVFEKLQRIANTLDRIEKHLERINDNIARIRSEALNKADTTPQEADNG